MNSSSIPEAKAAVRVLCLGNDLLADDGFGPEVARELRKLLPALDVVDTTESGLCLLEYIQNTSCLIVVDAVSSGRAVPGTVFRWEETDLRATRAGSPHFAGLFDTVAIGREIGLRMPKRIAVLAVEVADLTTIGGKMTPAVRQSVPKVLSVIQELTECCEPLQVPLT